MSISKQQVIDNEYQIQGFVGPVDILTTHEAVQILDEFHKWKETLPNGLVLGDVRFKPHLYLPWANAIVRHPNLVRTVETLLGTNNILCWSSDFNIKDAQSDHYFSPHQDSTYAGLAPAHDVVTAWVAISDPVTEKEGCLEFWPGSHKLGQLEHKERLDANNLLSRGQYCSLDSAAGSPVSVQLRGGQASFHNFYTVHQSKANKSKQPRIGLAIRYMTGSVQRSSGHVKESVTLISGKLLHDGFDLEPVLPLDYPTQDDLERGRQAHKEAMQRESANYFSDLSHNKGYQQSYDECRMNQGSEDFGGDKG